MAGPAELRTEGGLGLRGGSFVCSFGVTPNST